MRGVVADEVERLGRASVTISTCAPSGSGRAEVAHLAVDLDRERGAREAGADRGGEVGAGGAVGEVLAASVGKHGFAMAADCVDPAVYRSPRWTPPPCEPSSPCSSTIAYLNAGTDGPIPAPAVEAARAALDAAAYQGRYRPTSRRGSRSPSELRAAYAG